jgi:hypothetical protein
LRCLILLGALALAGCTTGRAVNAPPIVDMRGVDQTKYNADVSECTQEKINTKFPYSDWPIITRCMERKGYRILEAAG